MRLHRRTCFTPVCPHCKMPPGKGETVERHECAVKEGPGFTSDEDKQEFVEKTLPFKPSAFIRQSQDKTIYYCLHCAAPFQVKGEELSLIRS